MLEFFALAQECAPHVHPNTLAAIVRTESRFKPFAIGVNYGKPQLRRQPTNKQEAVEAAKALIEKGYNIDMGLGQINSANMDWLGLSVEDAFDPCKNLSAAARVLTGNFQRATKGTPDQQQALSKAISAYNTGSFARGFTNGYVGKVVASHKQLVAVNYVVPAIVASGESRPAAADTPARPADPAIVTAPRRVARETAPAGDEPVKLQAERVRADPARVFAAEAHDDPETASALVY